MKFLYILPVIGVLFLFAQSNEAFGENTRIVSHDGIDGWKCTSGSLDSCPGGNKYPLSVSKTSGDGQPAPSLLISGDPQGGLACASKTIASDWYIQKVVLSFDVKSVTTSYFFPVTVIDGNLKNVSVPHFVWASGSHVIEKPIKNSDNDVTVQLCLKDKSTGCCDDTTTFYDNIKITTTEIDPVYVKALDDAERKAQQEKNDGKLEADAAKKAADDAEQLRKDADRKADEDERKADEDEARADAAQRSTKAIERSRDAAKEAMFYAEKALRLAEETREIAEKEEQYWEQVANAERLAREAEKKADEARERAEDAEEARSYKEKEQARDDAEAAAEAARDFADDVQRIAYDVQRTAIQVANAESPSDEPSLVPPEGGGCLIATAAFGSEMAPQVQFLRELRDNTVLQTTSGTAFMNTFNQFYYSFSPQIADYERENPVFKEMVKVSLTPLLTSLTLLNYVEIDSEEEMLGYGIGIILLNVGMYFVAPAVLIISLKKRLDSFRGQ